MSKNTTDSEVSNASGVQKSTNATQMEHCVYTWGLGKSGQLGTGRELTEHVPQKVRLHGPRCSRLRQVACGGLYTVIVTEDGEIFATGCGKYGRLGTGREDSANKFLKISLPEKVSKVSCGSWHGAAVTSTSGLITWGHQKTCGYASSNSDLKTSGILVFAPLLILPSELKVSGVACGHNYTFAWLFDGMVLSWGSGHHGILGHSTLGDVLSPKYIDALKEVQVVEGSAGYSHSAFVTSDGCVYVCGKAKDGALGLGKRYVSDVLSPQLVTFPVQQFIVKVSCSVGEHHGHTLAISTDGKAFAWGDGYKGKLGLGDNKSRFTPTPIPFIYFNNESVKQVCAGGIHSVAVTAAGNIYTWGCGSDGRLGHPEGQGHRYLFCCNVPKRVDGMGHEVEDVVISCSYYHTAAIVAQ